MTFDRLDHSQRPIILVSQHLHETQRCEEQGVEKPRAFINF